MVEISHRFGSHILCVLAAVWLAALSGCGGEKSSEFHSYKELESQATRKPAAIATTPGKMANGELNAARKTDATTAEVATTPQPPTDLPANESATEDLSSAATPSREPVVAKVAEPDDVGDQQRSNGSGHSTVVAVAPTPSVSPAPNEESPDDSPRLRVPLRAPVVALRPGETAPPKVDSPAAPAGPLKIQLLVPTKEFKIEGPEGAIRVSYDDLDLLKVLNMEPVPADAAAHFPPWLKELDGKRIRVRGFMYPTEQETGLKGFLLARDNQICCFGRDPKIYDVFPVRMRKGVTANFILGRPFDVVGLFHIRPEDAEGKLYNLYEVDDAILIEK